MARRNDTHLRKTGGLHVGQELALPLLLFEDALLLGQPEFAIEGDETFQIGRDDGLDGLSHQARHQGTLERAVERARSTSTRGFEAGRKRNGAHRRMSGPVQQHVGAGDLLHEPLLLLVQRLGFHDHLLQFQRRVAVQVALLRRRRVNELTVGTVGTVGTALSPAA